MNLRSFFLVACSLMLLTACDPFYGRIDVERVCGEPVTFYMGAVPGALEVEAEKQLSFANITPDLQALPGGSRFQVQLEELTVTPIDRPDLAFIGAATVMLRSASAEPLEVAELAHDEAGSLVLASPGAPVELLGSGTQGQEWWLQMRGALPEEAWGAEVVGCFGVEAAVYE